MTVFYTIYSPENKGYWVGGLGSDAEYSLRVEGAQPVIGLEDDVTKLLDDVDTDPSSKIYWEKHETPDLPGSESMQAYLV